MKLAGKKLAGEDKKRTRQPRPTEQVKTWN